MPQVHTTNTVKQPSASFNHTKPSLGGNKQNNAIKNAISPVDIPVQGEYSPIGWIKNPIPSPKKQAQKPATPPSAIPASAEKNIVKENCTTPSLISKLFTTTASAVVKAIYATFPP